MGGMALGSWLLPKLTPQGAHPFRVVAALEAGIAFFGIAIPLALPYIQQVYLTLAEPGAGAVTLRAVVCVLVLTPPTMLMGATLPAIARVAGSRHGAERRSDMLYMANLAGGADRHGARGLLPAARLRHGRRDRGRGHAQRHRRGRCSGCMARLHAPEATLRHQRHPRHAPHAVRTVRHRSAPDLRCSGAVGFTALGAEVVWTRQLSLLFGASVYTFSLILAVFLAGLGIGGLAGIAARAPASDRGGALGLSRSLLAGAIAFGAWAIVNVLPRWQPTALFLPQVRATPSLAFAFDALRCAFALLPATILWGASFPLTLAAGRRAPISAATSRASTRSTPPARSPARSRSR